MSSKEKFERIVRYLFAHGNQTFVDQINQPPIKHPRDDLPGQRALFYLAIVMVIVAFGAIFWLLAQ